MAHSAVTGDGLLDVQVRDTSILCTFPSEMSHIGHVTDTCRDFLMTGGVVRRDDVNLVLDMALVLRELLANAITHGNRCDAERLVRCTVERMVEARIKITVEDEGAGFDYRSLDLSLPLEPRNARSRGFALVNTLADRLEFNEAGNQVSAYIALDKNQANGSGGETWSEAQREQSDRTKE